MLTKLLASLPLKQSSLNPFSVLFLLLRRLLSLGRRWRPYFLTSEAPPRQVPQAATALKMTYSGLACRLYMSVLEMTSDLKVASTGRVTESKGVCRKIRRLCLCTYQSKILCCQIIRRFRILFQPVQMLYSCLNRRKGHRGRCALKSTLCVANVAICLSHKLRVTALQSSFYQEYLRVIYPLLLVHRDDYQQFLHRLRALIFCLIFLRHSHSTLNVIEAVIVRFQPGFAQATGHF